MRYRKVCRSVAKKLHHAIFESLVLIIADTSPLQDPSGNRLATIIVYLNDVKSGGATCFKDLDLQIKPVKGKALLFFPSFVDGSPDDRTMHAGQVAMDTKWIAQM